MKGTFSFAHAIEDADAEVAFVKDPVNIAKYHIDPNKIVILGHSMGGYMVASAAAHDPKVAGVVMISAWNIGGSFPPPEAGAAVIEKAKKGMAASFIADNNVAPLAGCTAESLVAEAYAHRTEWNFDTFAPALASRPFLVITSDDHLGPADHAFVVALQKAGDSHVTETHFAADHPYSGQRIALTTAILNWLGSF